MMLDIAEVEVGSLEVDVTPAGDSGRGPQTSRGLCGNCQRSDRRGNSRET